MIQMSSGLARHSWEENTAGSFYLYFDVSDAGRCSNGEDIEWIISAGPIPYPNPMMHGPVALLSWDFFAPII
jgi:hypothetical protein